MNHEDIVRIAYEVGEWDIMKTDVEYQFALAIAEEVREACARLCDDMEKRRVESMNHVLAYGGEWKVIGPKDCAVAIRGEHDQDHP